MRTRRPALHPTISAEARAHRPWHRSRWVSASASLAVAALVVIGIPTTAFADDAVPPTPTSSTEPTTPPTDAPSTSDPTPAPDAATSTEAPAPAEESTDTTTDPADSDDADATTDGSDASATAPEAARQQPEAAVLADPLTSIRVTKGGLRQADGSVSGLAGVRFVAIDRDYGESPDGVAPTAECTTIADGSCLMQVPERNAGPNDGYWILEEPSASAPLGAGWDALDSVATGGYTVTKTVTPYRYHTGPVAGAATITDVPGGAGVRAPSGASTASHGTTWANELDNPPFPTVCGLQIAIVIDRSNSISASEMSKFRAAVQAFVGPTGLGDTPSTADVYTFNTTATKVTSAPQPMGSPELTAAVTAATAGQGEGFTNWDAALRLVAASPAHYDTVLMLTDGDPTTFGSGAETSGTVNVRDIEEAVFSANAVKAEAGAHADGTKIVGVGVGLTTNSELSLQAITGPQENEDYFLTDDWDGLGGELRTIATRACGGTLTVQKQLVDAAGTVTDPDAAGWTFTAQGALQDDDGDPVTTLSETTPDDGMVNYAVDFSSTGDKTITVTETTQTGYTLHPQGGSNALCTVDGSGRPVVNTADGFSVTVKLNEIVSCVVQNENVAATVQVDKHWLINGVGYDGANPLGGFSAGLTLAPAPANAPAVFGTVHTGYVGGTDGSVVTVGENVATLPEGCLLTDTLFAVASGSTGAGINAATGVTDALKIGANHYLVTNTVTCPAPLLALVKKVTSTTQNADGTWTIVYGITVTNPSTLSATYNLGDQPVFGAGIQVLSATAVGPNGAANAWPGTGPLATARSLAGGASDVYVITVNASVGAGVIGTDAGDCVIHITERGTGFLNAAVLISGGRTILATACDVPAAPTLTKAFLSKTQNPDGTWNVAYTVNVANASTKALVYSLSDAPLFPVGVSYNSYTVTAAPGTPAPLSASGSAPIAFPIPIAAAASIPSITTHSYIVTLNVTVDPGTLNVDEAHCTTDETPGVGFLNQAVLTSGNDIHRAEDCSDIPLVDVGIEKAYVLPDGGTAIEGGSTFDYTLTVTNNGPDSASGVVVTDTLDPELEFVGTAADITVSPNVLTASVSGPGNRQITLTGAGPFPAGVIATITVPVRMIATPPVGAPPVVGPNDPVPTLPTANTSDVPNEACVSIAENDTDSSNDCDTVTVPTKRINTNAYVRCVNDVPWLYYNIALTPSVPSGPVTVTWTSADGTQTETRTIDPGQLSGRMLWPGALVDANGVGIGYPGWRPFTPADLGGPLQRFEDLVLDPSLPSYAWRDQVNPASITFQINPTQTVLAVYPQALPACAVERDHGVAIEKTASVDRVDVGDDFDYTLAVSNVGDGVAWPVRVNDTIPADLRVDGIAYGAAPVIDNPLFDPDQPAGPGNEPTIPSPSTWNNSCAVTGADGDGYGGTLNCQLQGVLGPRIPQAPDIILHVHVKPTTTATSLVNTAEVCWGSTPPTLGEVQEGANPADGVPTPDCSNSTVTVLVKQVVLVGQAVCVRDTPLFSYSVTPVNLTTAPQVLLIWWTPSAFATHDPSLHDPAAILADGASQVNVIAPEGGYTPGQTLTGQQLWPGAAVDAAGNPIAWPGWKHLPTGQWVLDPSAPFYNLRSSAVVEIRVNPTVDAITAYPPATPNCNAAPPRGSSLASTGFQNGWVLWPAIGLIALGLAITVAFWFRRRREQG
ncbi:VWA domain-containing protein [Rathayibacter sp. YIM 133350]|uniref:VWA domain-containing protein n=1 Tax=Rathayibacter sp. YIM 133350 TaxID=3131992 RepID=UPI00307D4140